jgi:uncharacterized protein (TIGR02266 family)
MSAWRILVADDEPLVLEMIKDTLEALPASVLKAQDGEEALRLAKTERPDLILLDVMMPKLDGFGVAEALKRDPTTATIPLIFVSALGASRDKVRGLDLGAEDYLTKPINADELRRRVRKILGRAQPPRQEPTPIATPEPSPPSTLEPPRQPTKDSGPASLQVPDAQEPAQSPGPAPTTPPAGRAPRLPPATAPARESPRTPPPEDVQEPLQKLVQELVEEFLEKVEESPGEMAQAPVQVPAPPTGLLASGQLHAMNLESLVQLLENERHTAKLLLARGSERGEIAFVDGAMSRAIQGPRQGEAAVYQLLTWREGMFQLHVLDAPSHIGGAVTKSNQALLIEGMRRLDECPALRSGLPDPTVPLEVPGELRAAVQKQAKPEAAALMALLDGTRNLEQVLAQSPFDDWTTMRDLTYLLGTRAIPPKHVSPEIRTGPRVVLELPIEFQRVPPFQQAPSCNLSARGVFIQVATPYEIGEQVLLRFTLPGQETPVKVMGQVVSRNTEPGKPGGVGMGVRFLDLPAADREIIERNLAEAIADGLSHMGEHREGR